MQEHPAAFLAEILVAVPTSASDPAESLFGPVKLDRETVRGRLRPTVRDHVAPKEPLTLLGKLIGPILL